MKKKILFKEKNRKMEKKKVNEMEHVLVIVTAKNCPGCHSYKGSGKLGCKNQSGQMYPHMSPSYIRSLIQPVSEINHNILLINFNFKDKSAPHNKDNMDYISTMALNEDNKVEQLLYYEENGNVIEEKIVETDDCAETKEKKILVKNGKSMNWEDFCNTKLPMTLSNYIYQYPQFIIFEGRNWHQAVKRPEVQLKGKSSNGKTIQLTDGTIKCIPQGNQFMPEGIVGAAVRGNLNLEPEIEKKEEKPVGVIRPDYAHYW